MVLLDLIERKRDGLTLDRAHWDALIAGIKQGELADYQLAAFNVAAAIRGLAAGELEALLGALQDAGVSADRLELADIGIDKPLYGGHLPAPTRRSHKIIGRKLAGKELSAGEIKEFIEGVTDNTVRDEDLAAFSMAVFIHGMTPDEILALTQSMLHSGEVLQWDNLPGPTVDKHSTGGVGDKVSLPLAGVLAACGAYVPMISGRGLGHTGGTLDKLQAIPGYRIDLSAEEFRACVREHGASIIGQTATLAPADRRMYAIRDVVGTVSSIPLITASILSKKLAEGLNSLVLDVKVGSGAFMETFEDAKALADSLSRVGRAAGVKVSALLTPMDQPLGSAVGNANEVMESVACLRGQGPRDLEVLVIKLGAELLVNSGLQTDADAAERAIKDAISSGRALAAFRGMVEAQGGDTRVIDNPERFKQGSIKEVITAEKDGYVQRLHARGLGRALIALGGGRRVQEDIVDPTVGIWILKKLGWEVKKGETVIEIYANEQKRLDEARAMIVAALEIGSEPPRVDPLILARR